VEPQNSVKLRWVPILSRVCLWRSTCTIRQRLAHVCQVIPLVSAEISDAQVNGHLARHLHREDAPPYRFSASAITLER